MAYDFDKIARRYDRMNCLMTLGLDRRWRRRAAREIVRRVAPLSVLDVACGTGDMIAALQKETPRGALRATGVDLSKEMLAIASKKCGEGVALQVADAESLPYGDATFDAISCAFGVRNFVNLEAGLHEMARVLRTGGCMAVLELATPDSRLLLPFYRLYAGHLIPWLGSRIAGNRAAYTYLPQSIERFPKGEDFMRRLRSEGFQVRQEKLTFGVCRLYVATKG